MDKIILEQRDIDRTTMGVVPLSDIIESVRYVDRRPFDPRWGARTTAKAHERFLSLHLRGRAKEGGVHSFDEQWRPLYCILKDRRLGYWTDLDAIGSLEVIEWPHARHVLVTRQAPGRHVGSEWLAFCPAQEAFKYLHGLIAESRRENA